VLLFREDMTATAALGPVLDHLIHRARRQQIPSTPFVARLAAAPASGAIFAALGPARRIRARWSGGIARVAIQLALELCDALVLAGDTLLKAAYLLVHAQQHLDDHLTARLIDRLGLGALHA